MNISRSTAKLLPYDRKAIWTRITAPKVCRLFMSRAIASKLGLCRFQTFDANRQPRTSSFRQHSTVKPAKGWDILQPAPIPLAGLSDAHESSNQENAPLPLRLQCLAQEEALIISLDAEVHCHNKLDPAKDIITEVGICLLDTRDLKSAALCPGPRGVRLSQLFFSRLLAIREHPHKSCPEDSSQC